MPCYRSDPSYLKAALWDSGCSTVHSRRYFRCLRNSSFYSPPFWTAAVVLPHAAVAFADAFDRRPDLIIVSPYLRTRQTAAPFIAKYSDVPVEFWPIQEFNYLDNQKCLGTTIDERRAMRDAFMVRGDADWRDGDDTETFNEMVGRAHAFIERLRWRDERFIVVFSHGLFIRTLATILDGDTPTIECILQPDSEIPNLNIFKFSL